MKSNNNKKNRQINTMFQRKQGGDREYLETLLHIRGDLSEKLTCEIKHPTLETNTEKQSVLRIAWISGLYGGLWGSLPESCITDLTQSEKKKS